MKNLTDMIKESKKRNTIFKSGYFLMVFDAPVTPMNYTHTKDVTVSCSAANSLQNSLKEIL